jgi:NADH pyrophosphatase NudC (nudix superfamily)
VIVKLQVVDDSQQIVVDKNELHDAQWMSVDHIRALLEEDPTAMLEGKVSTNNWKLIDNALNGSLVVGTPMKSSRGTVSMLYTAGL